MCDGRKEFLMSKAQFLELLSQKLSEELSREDVMSQLKYYEEYIYGEMKKGRSEEEVMMELGDPYMIARTILDTSTGAVYEDVVYEDAVSVDTEGNQSKEPKRRSIVMGNWGCLLTVLVLILIGIALISVIGSVVVALLPVIIPVAAVLLVIALVNGFRK